MLLKRDNEIISATIVDDRVIANVKIGDAWVSNPTYGELLKAGFEEFTPQDPPPSVPTYKEIVVSKIREKYSMDDELAILRQRDTKPEEFMEYNDFVEQCKINARTEG
jgi:hypothetical protein